MSVESSPLSAILAPRPTQSFTTFRGRSLEEARKIALEELGDDLTLVASRRIPREGMMGFFGAEEYEVTALARPRAHAPAPLASAHPFAMSARAVHETQQRSDHEMVALRSEVRNEVRSLRTLIAKATSDHPDGNGSRAIEDELAQLRDLLTDIAVEKTAPAQVKKRLAALGIEGDAARAIVSRMRTLGGNSEKHLIKAIADLVKTAPWPVESEGRSLVALVGPTGVGKTTTAAKIAARAILEMNRTVTLISCDSFRVGATEQMERYADLLGAELRIVRTPAELESAVTKSSTHLTIVDTGGRGPRDRDGIEASIPRIKVGGPGSRVTRHTLLCMPACIRDADARRVQKFFEPCAATALAITKLDETGIPAGIVHAAVAAELPVAALCFGQSVPEDIAAASTDDVLGRLFVSKPAKRSRAAA